RPHCAPEPSGSTATTSSTPRCPSAATSSPVGDARWVKMFLTSTRKPRRCAQGCRLADHNPIRLREVSRPDGFFLEQWCYCFASDVFASVALVSGFASSLRTRSFCSEPSDKGMRAVSVSILYVWLYTE